MLAISRPVCRRNLIRSLSTAVASTPPTAQDTPPAPRARRRETQTSNGKLFIKPWDGIPSMPDALAVVRAVERKYGKLKSFKMIRDLDVTTHYVPYLWAELETPSNFQGEEVLKVPRPNVDHNRPGGVGLDDLDGLLAPHKRGSEWQGILDESVVESDKEQKFFDVRVQLSATEGTPKQWVVTQNRQFLVSDAFVKWGGFAPPSKRAASSSKLEQVLKKSRMIVEEHKSDLDALADQGLPNLDLVVPPPPPPEPRPFIYEFDEVVKRGADLATPSSQPQSRKASSSTVSVARAIREKEMKGIPLTKRERALKQASLLARTPTPAQPALRVVPKPPAPPAAPAVVVEKIQLHKPAPRESRPPPKAKSPESRGQEQTEKERKSIQDKLWNIVGGKWF